MTDTKRIEIQRNETSNPIVYVDIENAYTKGTRSDRSQLSDGVGTYPQAPTESE